MKRDEFMNKCISEGLTERDADVCCVLFRLSDDAKWSLKKASQSFSDEQIEQAVLGLINKLTVVEVDYYLRPEFSADKMYAMRSALLKGLDLEDLEEIYQDGFSCQQIDIACEYKDVVPDEFFQEIYQPHFSVEQMQVMFNAVKEKQIVSLKELEAVAKVEYSAERMSSAVTVLRQVGIEKAEFIQNPYLGMSEILELICAVKHGVADDIIRLLSSCMYDGEQLCQLRLGAEHGFTPEQLKVYMDPEFDAAEMKARRLAIEQGVDISELEQYFHPLFSKAQTDVITQAFLEGLSLGEIAFIADYKFTAGKMAQALYGFMGGLSIGDVSLYYKNKYSELQMKHARLCLGCGIEEERIGFLLSPKHTVSQMIDVSHAFRHETDREKDKHRSTGYGKSVENAMASGDANIKLKNGETDSYEKK